MPFDALPAKPDDVLTVLTQARVLLSDPMHWGKSAYYDRGHYCAIGAINHATTYVHGDAEERLRVHIAAKGYLYRALPRGQGAVIPYNDKTTTKHANILALFDRAIKARVSQLTKAVVT